MRFFSTSERIVIVRRSLKNRNFSIFFGSGGGVPPPTPRETLNPQLKIPTISQKIRFSQNRFYAYSDGKYGFKTCLRHQEDSFHAKYHHFESFKGLFKNSNFCQKCDFLRFFEIFDLWVIFRFFRSKQIKNGFKCFQKLLWVPKHIPNTLNDII